jgi:hypothetical protein
VKPKSPDWKEYYDLADQYGGSIVVTGLTDEEQDWSNGCPLVYRLSSGLFITNNQFRLDKPTIFFDSSWTRIELTPEQQKQFDADWEEYMAFNRFIDWEGRLAFGPSV